MLAAIIELASNIFRLSQDYLRASALRGGSMSTLSTAEEGSVMPSLKKFRDGRAHDELRFLPPTMVQDYCLDFELVSKIVVGLG